MRSRTLFLVSCGLLLLAACGNSDTVKVDSPDTDTGAVIETQKVQVFMNNGKAITDPDHGREKGFWYGAIEGSNGTKANGVGYVYYFEDGSFKVTLNANIEMLAKGSGQHYVAWMTNASGSDPVRVGTMANLFGDVRHSASLETKTDLTSRNHVLITKEASADATTPGTAVATGELKRYDRPQ